MTKKIVISLYDHTSLMVKPWADAGYTCVCLDIQHSKVTKVEGNVTYKYADLHKNSTLEKLISKYKDNVAIVFGFPVCTDLAVSGASSFKKKLEKDKLFQVKAVNHAMNCAKFAKAVSAPYMVENPVSVLATQWRKPDFMFHPYEYSGYLTNQTKKHPIWPEYIDDYDVYRKRTCLWVGGGFQIPENKVRAIPKGPSKQHTMLGGKSVRTKNIRSCTPRGFARAVFEVNHVR